MKKTRKKYAKGSIIVYDNRIHTINLGNLSVLENNLLFTMFRHFKDSDTHTWSREDLKNMALSKNCNNARGINDSDISTIVKSIKDIIFKLDVIVRDNNVDTYHNLFSTFNVRYSQSNREVIESVDITLNDNMWILFRDLSSNFTILEEDEFKGFKSKYTQTLYRLLSEHSYKGEIEFKYDYLREQLGCPDAYGYENFNYRILKPSVKELHSIFKGLNYYTVKARTNGKLSADSIVFKFQKFTITKNESYEIFTTNNRLSKTTLFGLYKTKERLQEQSNYNIYNGKDNTGIEQSMVEIDKQISKLKRMI